MNLVCSPVLEPHTQGSYMSAGDPNLSKSFCCLTDMLLTQPSPSLSPDFKNTLFFWLLKSMSSSLIPHANSSGNRARLAEAYLWKSALCSRKANFKNQISSVLLLRSKSYLLSISDRDTYLLLSGSLCHIFLLFSIKRLHYLIPLPIPNL